MDLELKKLLATPRSFTEDELKAVQAEMIEETGKNAWYPTGIDAAFLRLMITAAREANRENEEGIAEYPGLHAGWENGRMQNPKIYTPENRPMPRKKILIGLGSSPGSAYPVPTWVVSEKFVCDPIPWPPAPELPQALTVAYLSTPNPYAPDEYPCLPQDNAPVGYVVGPVDGFIFIRQVLARPWGNYNYYQKKPFMG